MTVVGDIIQHLEGDATLVGWLTGGIHDSESLPPKGIARDTLPIAFEGGKQMRPLCVVRQRSQVPMGLADEGGYRTLAVGVDMYLYAPRDYTTIRQASERIIDLLDHARLPQTFQIQFTGSNRYREQSLQDAASIRVGFSVYIGRTSS
jgi:hypothetical protein